MSKREFLSHLLNAFLIMTIFMLGYILGQSPFAPWTPFGPQRVTPQEAQQAFEPFWETWELVNRNYFQQPLDQEDLAEGAINGMLATLDDPNTAYLSPEVEAANRQLVSGEFQGVGIQIAVRDGRIIIIAPFDGSPAEEAGLKAGDILLAADGVSLDAGDTAQAAALIRGPIGTVVTLTVQRGEEIFEVPVERDLIQVPSVEGELLEGEIAYIRISQFAERTTEELEEILTELMAQGPSGLILDLRHNPGGNLFMAVEVTDQFLPEGVALIERFGTGQEEIFELDDEGQAQEIPLVVLIDEASASASEIVAGAIQDEGRGVLMGETSFGKGTVQIWQGLSNGGGVRITIARWLTPEGNWVNETGLTPDIVVSAESDPVDEENDAQLEAALAYLRDN